MAKDRITIKGKMNRTLTTQDLGQTVIVSIRRDGILLAAIEVNKGDLQWQVKGD